MKDIKLILLAAAAIGVVSVGSISAMPFNNDVSATQGESYVQDVRVVCGRYHRCYNTGRTYRYGRSYYGPSYYGRSYYGAPGYGYYGGPRVGIAIGPFGIGMW
jgi:hypothetical protein